MVAGVRFEPQLSRTEAISLAAEYSVAGDDDALTAGLAIRRGDFSRTQLQTIFKWKTRDRGRTRLEKNSDAEIRDALALAVCAKEPRSAIAVLCGLFGVDTSVASAIMTAIDPEKYTILDYRALEALGITATDRSLSFYLTYLAYCRCLADKWTMPLRQLDRALLQRSANRTAARRFSP